MAFIDLIINYLTSIFSVKVWHCWQLYTKWSKLLDWTNHGWSTSGSWGRFHHVLRTFCNFIYLGLDPRKWFNQIASALLARKNMRCALMCDGIIVDLIVLWDLGNSWINVNITIAGWQYNRFRVNDRWENNGHRANVGLFLWFHLNNRLDMVYNIRLICCNLLGMCSWLTRLIRR